LGDTAETTLAASDASDTGLPLQRSTWMVPPAANPSLPADPHPLLESCDPSVYFDDRGSGVLVDRALLRPWVLAVPGPWSFPSLTALHALFRSWGTSTRGFSLSFRVSPKATPALRALSRVRLCPALSLSWGFHPFSSLQLEGAGSLGGSTRRHLASSGFVPS
jgi:hypothetical protein